MMAILHSSSSESDDDDFTVVVHPSRLLLTREVALKNDILALPALVPFFPSYYSTYAIYKKYLIKLTHFELINN